MFCWEPSILLEEFLQMSLPNELLNVSMELNAFFDCMTNILWYLQWYLQNHYESLFWQVSWEGLGLIGGSFPSRSVWRYEFGKNWGKWTRSFDSCRHDVSLAAPSTFMSLLLSVRGFFCPSSVMISKGYLRFLLSDVFIDALEEFVQRGWLMLRNSKLEVSISNTIG